MTVTMTTTDEQRDVPQALIGALFRHPEMLQPVMTDAGLAPHEVAMWARQVGAAPEIEKLAGWLSVGQQLDHYKPLLEVAGSHLRAGDLLEALPVFRWAYHVWRAAPGGDGKHHSDGAKLLALWGECLYRLNRPDDAQERWLHALTLVQDAETLVRLARTVERAGATQEYQAVLEEAMQCDLPGATALWQRWQRICETGGQGDTETRRHGDTETRRQGEDTCHATTWSGDAGREDAPGVAVLADVANLDQVCSDQYGVGRQLDYGRLLQAAGRHGPLQVKLAFVPDIPETLAIRQHLAQAGFQVDLKRPKRSAGRIVANADTAMAACAVRWASDPHVGRVELWTGDGDFLKVRDVIHQAWPDVVVVFRSFEVGTAAAIRQLEDAWEPIGPQYLQP